MAEIREGFLCPICMKDLGSVADLTDHFEEEHAEEDKAVLKQFKGNKFIGLCEELKRFAENHSFNRFQKAKWSCSYDLFLHFHSGLFDKAKRKILGKENREDGAMGFAQAYPDDIPTGNTIFETHGIDPAMWEPQELGTQNLFLEQDRKIKY